MASSWLYDITMAVAYKLFDLYAIIIAAIVLRLLLAAIIFLLAGGLRGRFWMAVLLSLIAQYLLASLQPLPVYCSVLALAAELTLLIRSRETGSLAPIYWLPLLFVLWANLDIHFVFGIVLLLLFWASSAAQGWAERNGTKWYESRRSPLPIKQLSLITGAAILASFVTPYGWRLYGLYFSQATSPANTYFPELQALRFRSPQDYILMLLIMAAFLALGLRRSRDPFFLGLLVLCTVLAFRSQSDTWLAVLASIAVLAGSPRAGETKSELISSRQLFIATLAAVIVLVAAGRIYLPHGRSAALAKISKSYPVSAANYIRDSHLPQPLFNPLPWGGFLTWYLPEYPVTIDGRTDLYGSDFNIQYAKTMNFDQHYSAFAPLNQAGTLLLQKDSLMGQALPSARGFKTVYSDDVAVVLLREGSTP